jgi:hypothetical protein
MDQNLLARSRLESALNLFKEARGPTGQTITAALNALLNPEPTDDVIRAGANTKIVGCDDIVGFMTALNCHKSMMDELTKETT